MADTTQLEWAETSETTQWIHTFKGHLEVGGSARSKWLGRARRGLVVALEQPGDPHAPFGTAIQEAGRAFATHGRIRDKIPTDLSYLLIPIRGFSLAEYGGQQGALFPSLLGRERAFGGGDSVADYDIKRMPISLQLHYECYKFDRAYPISQVPIVAGRISSGMVSYNWALSNVLWLVINGFANATLWVTGDASVYFGEKAGKFFATTADVYASVAGVLFGDLTRRRAIGKILARLTGGFSRGFLGGSPIRSLRCHR